MSVKPTIMQWLFANVRKYEYLFDLLNVYLTTLAIFIYLFIVYLATGAAVA
jgi:hypothetical protein